jgi:pseudouridine-5'-phosphate glycosidase
VPATCAVLAGELRVGLSPGEVEALGRPGVEKAGARDLAWLVSRRASGATTVSATLELAARAGIRLFATGGIGGVHRGLPIDISADLLALATAPVAVVASGAKSILDVEATLEALEALSVPVLGLKTDRFPRFYVASGPPLERSLAGPAEAAAYLHAHFVALGRRGGVLLAHPAPEALPEAEHDAAVKEALSRAARAGVRGKATTPFLLSAMREILGDAALSANAGLIVANAKAAGEVAVELATSPPV